VFKRIISKITAAALSVSLYLPVVTGTVTGMGWVVGGLYFSWSLLQYIVPYSNRWYDFVYVFNRRPEGLEIGIVVAFRFSQVLMFCLGLFLLCYGLVILVRARVHEEGLITHGPYSWVRHPQHLGILLMLFLLAFPLETSYSTLLYPVTRPGDLISMCSVLFLLFLVADFEDYWLSKEYGDFYLQYQQNTPFILPIRIQLPKSMHINMLKRGQPLRYILATLFFWVFLVLLSYHFRIGRPPIW